MTTCALHSEDQPISMHSCANCLVRKLSLFDCIGEDKLTKLNSNRTMTAYKAGEYIYKQGMKPAGLHCLASGKVKITMDSVSGTEQIISLKKPVDFLGFSDLMGEEVHCSAAIAMEDSQVCLIPLDDFRWLVESDIQLSLKIVKYLAQELTIADQRTANLTQKHMRARLADTLLYILDVYGMEEKSDVLDLDLKRSDLAGLSNMSTANAIRTLSEFVKSNLVDVDGRRIAVKDLKGLQNISLQG